MQKRPLLEVRDLVVQYGSLVAVRGVSLSVEEGMIVSLIGANGAGKTTLLKAITGMVMPSSGEIWFDGQRIDRLPAHRRVALGITMVPEGRRLFPKMSVLENLELGAYALKDRRDIADRLRAVFGRLPMLEERRRARASSLSGGQQQMLAIGRALMSRPKLILLDEPSLGLSPIMVAEIGKIVRDLNERWGTSVLLVEQNARLALTVAHKGYVMETGYISLEGMTNELLGNEQIREIYLGISSA